MAALTGASDRSLVHSGRKRLHTRTLEPRAPAFSTSLEASNQESKLAEVLRGRATVSNNRIVCSFVRRLERLAARAHRPLTFDRQHIVGRRLWRLPGAGAAPPKLIASATQRFQTLIRMQAADPHRGGLPLGIASPHADDVRYLCGSIVVFLMHRCLPRAPRPLAPSRGTREYGPARMPMRRRGRVHEALELWPQGARRCPCEDRWCSRPFGWRRATILEVASAPLIMLKAVGALSSRGDWRGKGLATKSG